MSKQEQADFQTLTKPRRKRSTLHGGHFSNRGKLFARIQYFDHNGKRKSKARVVPSGKVADVRKIIAEMRRELEQHGEEALLSDKMTFEQLAERYRTTKVFPAQIKDGKKIGGLKSYRSEEGNLRTLVGYFGRKTIRTIRPHDVEVFKKQRLDTSTRYGRERKVASVNRELSTLRAMLNFALRNDWIPHNPCVKVENLVSASLEVERERILSYEEERRLFAVLTGGREHLKPILICALDTAMRPEEIFKLRWRDVDLRNKSIRVIAENSKNERARNVGMTTRLYGEFQNMWDESPQRLEMSVFGTKSIKTAFNTACRLAGLTDLRFRDFRHTATTRMVNSGMSHAEVMKITGHTQVKTFLRYVNLTKENASDSASRFSAFLEAKHAATELESNVVN